MSTSSQLENIKQQQQSPNSFQRPSSTPSPSLSINGNNNQLIANNSNSSKPLKCVLPPVSQEQFDKYSFIHTEELVKKVKDLLSKFSISQRLFGECILGLSQGSVSDLLARPKPWVMLTQKGREPFIRMQMFIDDPDAIKKLMANQYKTPSSSNENHHHNNNNNSHTNKLARASSVGSTDGNFKDSSSNKLSSSSASAAAAYLAIQQQQSNNQIYLNNLVNSSLHLQNHVNHSSASSTSSNQSSSSFHHHSHQNNSYHHQQQHHSNLNENSNDSELKTNFQTQINIIPYDISSMSSIGDLNTEEITNRVKETLLNNNIGQKLFGEAVLNLSQGTVSELLSKPKPWNTLSIKGREPYLRMYMWLNDNMRLEKLNEWKEEKNLLKRNNTEVETDHQKPKRRFIFSEEQKDQLMKAFKYDPYPAVNQMEALATKLSLQTRTVINWFHNHRMRIRYKNSTSSSSSSGVAVSPQMNNLTVRNRNQQFNNNNNNSLDPYQSFQYFSTSNNNNNNNNSNDVNKSNSMYHGTYEDNNEEEANNQNNRLNYEDEDEEEDEDFNSDSSKKKTNSRNNTNANVNRSDEDDDEEEDDEIAKNNINYMEQLKKNAALLSLVSSYNLPILLSAANKLKNENKLINQTNNNEEEEDEEENEDHDTNANAHNEDDEDENDSSSVQNDLSIDQEAEINSMYIPGNNNNDSSENVNDENEHENSYWLSNKSFPHTFAAQNIGGHANNNNSNNKRRKPHNPQKLNLALNLLNNKNQNKLTSNQSTGSANDDSKHHNHNQQQNQVDS